ncbi:MAG TPA: exonuclease domain-containing protein [Chitinophagaceae bacterium]|jgi:DNA polymerase-3 subunit epsilon|nr:exonuclease domain-containing protein [Chitinophagaceae bacterium]
MEKLQLKRPLAFIDLETTGINIGVDKIIEIAIIKIMPDGSSFSKVKRINPGIPIPKESSDVHGILDEDVKDSPTFKEVANELRQFLDNCDLAGYNSNRFDIPLLVEEFLRIGQNLDTNGRKLVDVQRIFHLMEKRTLEAAYLFYCKKELNDAHTAEADARATFEILEAQVNHYLELKNDVEELARFTTEDDFVDFARRMVRKDGVEFFNFGKYKGKAVRDVLRDEPQYYDWMMKADFPLHTKQKLSEIFNELMLKKS